MQIYVCVARGCDGGAHVKNNNTYVNGLIQMGISGNCG